ncbi:DUF2059 domain-containing protein [Pacificibacter marinus]|uniref:DUF2059 domain-containing protein n=1 Tax=Pacificibacter marinus TaxID=658057 RepID=A0A1Y5T3I0_9RHOB|nr:DUF2059 domain-containing protein [Pacificibacter marinus]SEK99805.1 hypothetical protein SAMN04488032_109122 [Pacificibacter marinus]SLN54536.1 hypothetical protein PAM7971_02813 [Pacificibacter marinus]
MIKHLPLRAFCVSVLIGTLGVLPVSAAPIDRLMDLMKFEEVIEVLAEEGRSMADETADADLGVPRFAWDQMMVRLYDEATMKDAFRAELNDALGTTDLTPIVAFFETDLGRQIADLELNARKAIADEAVLAAAGDLWAELDPQSKRAQLIEDYVTVNDLIELNIVGSLNSDIAYYRGFSAGSPGDLALDESEIMREVWAGEPEARAHVSEWVYGFSALAYEPLNEADFGAYVDFGRSEAGRALNLAMFAAFDNVYADLARGLGAGTATLLKNFEGEEL